MKILHVIHDFLPRHRAGSELYAYRLALAQKAHHDVSIFCAEYEPGTPHGTLRQRDVDGLTVHEVVNNWHFDSFGEAYLAPVVVERFFEVLRETQCDVVHIHNLLNLSLDLPLVAKAYERAVVATLHDHTLVCPSGGQRIHMAEHHICHTLDPERCARCFTQSPFAGQLSAGQALRMVPSPTHSTVSRFALKTWRRLRQAAPKTIGRVERLLSEQSTKEIDAAAIRARLAHVQHVYDAVDRFVSPSPALGQAFLDVGMPKEKLEISDYGFEPLPTMPLPSDDVLHIGFVGTPVWHKGVHVLLEALAQLPPKSYVAHIFGSLETFPDYVSELRRLAKGHPVIFEGGFDHEQRSDVYATMDLAVVPSLWPENSPLVIHEAFQAGRPVVGARSGGIVDLIEHEKNGLLYPPASSEALAQSLQRLIDDRDFLRRLAAHILAVKPMATDVAEWNARYQRLAEEQLCAS